MKRAWNDRLVSNYQKIDQDLIDRWLEEEGISDEAIGNDKASEIKQCKEFLDWVGLSHSPSAIKKVRSLFRAELARCLIDTAEGY